jgi:hypothetical protein
MAYYVYVLTSPSDSQAFRGLVLDGVPRSEIDNGGFICKRARDLDIVAC